ncbi:hypothetical protein [uncultured Nonlabens sp.]|jgi:hypothetical protein
MKSEKKDKCCQGCKKGKPGENLSCQAKLLFEELQKKKELAKNKES